VSLVALVALGVVPAVSLIALASLYPLARLYGSMKREVPVDADPRTAQATLFFGILYIASILASSLL
jgi:hypothetical protein